MKTIKLNFDGIAEDCFVETKSDEYVCHTKDGRIVKFPAGVDLKMAAKAHNDANSEVPEPANEAALKQAEELAAWKAGE